MAKKKSGPVASGTRDTAAGPALPPGVTLLSTLAGHEHAVDTVAFDRQGETLASGSYDKTVKLWEASSGKLLRTLKGHQSPVGNVAFDPQGETLASGSDDKTVKLWEARSGKLLRTLEGHTGRVECVAFSADGRLLASKSADHTIRLWSCETWETVAVIPKPTLPEPTLSGLWIPALAFHPTLPTLATAGSEPNTPNDERSRLIHLWDLDLDVLLGHRTVSGKALAAGETRADDPPAASAVPLTKTVHSTTAKIVLVGDSGVGKTGLGWRLAHGEYREHDSTHGQQFWVLNQLATTRQGACRFSLIDTSRATRNMKLRQQCFP